MWYEVSTGDGLRTARKQMGWTQAQLARLVSTPPSYIAALEHRTTIPAAMQARLADVFSLYPHAKFPHVRVPPRHGPPDASHSFAARMAYLAMPPALPHNPPAVLPAPAAPLEPMPPSGRHYQRLTPAEKQENRAADAHVKGVATRNQLRAAARPVVAALQVALAEKAAAQDWTAYHAILANATLTHDNAYITMFQVAAGSEVLAAADPRVTLPPEPLSETAS